MTGFRLWCILILLAAVQGAIIERFSAGRGVSYQDTVVPLTKLRDSLKRIDSKVGLYGFSWNNCGQPSSVLKINSLTVSPTPISIPGEVQVTLNSTVLGTIPAELEVELKIEYHEIIWITAPCVDDVGSCTYKNVCEKLPKTVTCPPKKGPLNISKKISIKKDVPHGKYRVTAHVKDQTSGAQLACFQVEAEISG